MHLGRPQERQVRRCPGAMETRRGRLTACGRSPGHQGSGDPRRSRVLRAQNRREAARRAGPQRFGLEYVAADGARHQPLMVHRALYGSIELFFGTLVEHYAGAFPVWLAPVQVVVMPITDRQLDYAKTVQTRLEAAGLRSHLDDRKEKVNLKIREAQLQKVPYMLVVGDREAEAGTVSVRHRKHGDLGAKPLDQFIEEVCKLVEAKSATE